jgi:prepilin-type N-terminal cleavage/methylation domain-containing protein
VLQKGAYFGFRISDFGFRLQLLRHFRCSRSATPINPKSEIRNPKCSAFTLIEILIALTIMSLAMSVVIAAFVATLRGWHRGTDLIDKLHHGDFVMEQLVSATRSAAFFHNRPDKFGFWLEDEEGGDYPTDEISFVTSGKSFLPGNSIFANGMHRIFIDIADNEDNEASVAIRVMPHLANLEDWEDSERLFVSATVKGLQCRVYNMQEEEWQEEWENTNAIPSLVEYTIFMDPLEDDEKPVTISRVVEIPVSPVVDSAVQFNQEDAEAAEAAREAAESQNPEGGGETEPTVVEGAETEPTVPRP